MEKRQITIKDIAKALNVSPSTVSRSLADHPDISRKTKNRVQTFACEHKYRPNAMATGLRMRNNKTVGVILPQIVHHFFSSILSGIEDEAEKCGYRVIISHSNETYQKEVKGAKALLEARVCGVLASVAKTTTAYQHFQDLIDNNIPLVFFDRVCTGILTDRVVADDYNGVHSAVEYLIRTGCRRIAFFGSPSHLVISNNRRMGYEDALRKHQLPVDKELVRICDCFEEALLQTPELLALPEPPDAFFAVNDETAIGILHAVKAKGLKIPAQVSICGFSNNSLGRVSDPLLTTVDQHGYEMGMAAMRLLIERLDGFRDGENIVSKVVPTHLVVRNTTR